MNTNRLLLRVAVANVGVSVLVLALKAVSYKVTGSVAL
jgi:divalent metal cation (Fe/Co/Zn/Cd) transporter